MSRLNKNKGKTGRSRAHGHVRRPLLSNRKVVFLATLAVLLAVGAFASTKAVIYNWAHISAGTQEFIARQIDARVKAIMVSGVAHTDPAALREALALEKGDSLVGFDARTARGKLEALDWVKSAGVVRILPSTVKVEVVEFTPLSRLEHDGDVWIIAPDGHLITKDFADFEHLPVLRGKGAKENAAHLFELLKQANLAEKVIAGIYVGERRWDIEFASGAIVKLPEEDAQQALAYLQIIQDERHLLDVADVMIDVRVSNKIVLRLPDGSSNKYL